MKKPSAKFYHILETIGALMFLTGTTLTFIGVLPHIRNHWFVNVLGWNNSDFYRDFQHPNSSKTELKFNGLWSYCSFNWSLQPQIKITLSKHSQHPKTVEASLI